MNCGKGCGYPVTGANRYVSKRKGICHQMCPKRRRTASGARKVKRHFMPVRIDREATVARKFIDPRSRVMQDGREILYKEDWTHRKVECFKRDNSTCQWGADSTKGLMSVCANPADEADHITKRSKKRDDRLSNLRSLCHVHHDFRHPEKRIRNPKEGVPNG